MADVKSKGTVLFGNEVATTAQDICFDLLKKGSDG